jgi:hypothetical protein
MATATERVEHFWVHEADLIAALRDAAKSRGSTVGSLGRDISYCLDAE